MGSDRLRPCLVSQLMYNVWFPRERCSSVCSGRGALQNPISPIVFETMPKPSNTAKVVKKDPVFVDGVQPRPMFVDYKDLDLLSKLTNRHGRIVGRRKTGCQAASQHAVSKAIKRARFMALLPYEGS